MNPPLVIKECLYRQEVLSEEIVFELVDPKNTLVVRNGRFLSVYSVHGGWLAKEEYPRKYTTAIPICKYNFVCVTTIKEISCEILFSCSNYIEKMNLWININYCSNISAIYRSNIEKYKPKVRIHLEISIPLIAKIMKFANLYP